MKKLSLLLFLGALVLISSCKKEEPEPTPPTTVTPTTQTKTMPVYISDIALNTHFGGSAPHVKITENGTSNEVTILVNTCAGVNGNTFTVTNGKTYNVIFGTLIGGTWAQTLGSGTMTVASDGQISGMFGTGNEVIVTKATNYGGCGTVVSGEILLFY